MDRYKIRFSVFVSFQSMVSSTNLYSGGKGAGQVNSKTVSLSFYELEAGGSRKEYSVNDLEDSISIEIPRKKGERLDVKSAKLYSSKYQSHRFNVTNNASTIHIQVGWDVGVEVELYVKKESEPNPSKGDYDFNTTLWTGGHNNSSNSSAPFAMNELFLSNDALNWSASGEYFVKLRYKENGSLSEDEQAKIDSDGAVPYNFSVYTSMCMYYDEKKGVWSTNGTWVRKVNYFLCIYLIND